MLHYDSLCGSYVSKEEEKGGGGGEGVVTWGDERIQKENRRRYLSGATSLLQGVKEHRGSGVT